MLLAVWLGLWVHLWRSSMGVCVCVCVRRRGDMAVALLFETFNDTGLYHAKENLKGE